MVDYGHAADAPLPRDVLPGAVSTTDAGVALAALAEEIAACSRCPLHASRTHPVPGEGDPHSELMFVGEAPGYHEDQQGRPFVGQAGRLLAELLASIGLTREQVFIANVLKSRPPNNRDPLPEEVAACEPYLWRQIELIRPKVICTLGNHATKLLTGNPAGITRVHGRPQVHEIAGQLLYVYPIFHPAAALYTPANVTLLRQDFLRLPDLLSLPRPQHDSPSPPSAEVLVSPALAASVAGVPPVPAEDRPHSAEPRPMPGSAPPGESSPAARPPVAGRPGSVPGQGEQLGLF